MSDVPGVNVPGVNLPLLGLYTIASFLHFAHNGLMLDSYPNLPASITAHAMTNAFVWFPNLVVARHFLK